MQLHDVLSITDSAFTWLKEHPEQLDVNAVYWGKVTLFGEAGKWVLYLDKRRMHLPGWAKGNGQVDVFGFVRGQQVFHKKSGGDYPKSEKDIQRQWNINQVHLELPSEDSLQLYVRIKGNRFGFPPSFHLFLLQPDTLLYQQLSASDFPFIEFLVGVIFITLLYHFMLYVFLRKKIYGWFCIWLCFSLIAILMVTEADPLSEYIFADYPGLRIPVWLFSANAIWITFWFFGRSFVGTAEKFRLFDRLILLLVGLLMVELAYILSKIFSIRSGDFVPAIGIHFFTLSLFTLMGLIISIGLALKKDPLARYFGVGALMATIATMLGGLDETGLIRLSFDPYTAGVFLQIVAYSFGLAYRQQVQDKAFRHAQQELLEAEKARNEVQRIKDLHEIKTRFFSNISHEFRTPLSLIIGLLRKTRRENTLAGDNHPIHIGENTLGTIQRNAERLQNLVDQLLELSKIETGHMQLQLTKGGLVKFIQSEAHNFDSLAQQKQIHFHTTWVQEPEVAYYDRDKLGKILNNLLSNALKYTPSGGTVGCRVQYSEGYLTLEVSDTGKGISRENVEKIFERFYRIEGNEETGSGIGLALTKELVALHNGRISVESTEGVGTRFSVVLPCHLSTLPQGIIALEQEQDEDIPAPVLVVEEEDPPGGQPLVLVVEDYADLRAYIVQLLSPHYRVLVAADGAEGERLAVEHLPHIVISDVMMPKQDGYGLCQALKSNIITCHIPVILLTAKAGQSNKMTGFQHGADVYLTKPFEEEELLLRMRNLLQARENIWKKFKSLDTYSLPDLQMNAMDDRFFRQVQDSILENIANEQYSVEILAREVGFSRAQLHRKLKVLVNRSANQLIRETRLYRAKALLEAKSLTVSEAAFAVGYPSLSYFSKSFKEMFGVLPSEV